MFVSELKTCFDLPRQCCAQNCLPTTLPRSLRQRGSLATLRNRRPSARCVTVARWGGLGLPLSSHGRLLLGNLCKFGRGAHRCVSAATIHHHFRIPPPGPGTLSGTATQHNHHSILPKYKYIILPLKCAAFNFLKNLRAGKGKIQVNKQIFKLLHFLHSLFRGLPFDFLQISSPADG